MKICKQSHFEIAYMNNHARFSRKRLKYCKLHCIISIYACSRRGGLSEMNKNFLRSVLLPSVIILFGGLFVLALCYALYLGVYLFVENVVFSDPSMMPTDQFRRFFTVALAVLYVFIFRSKFSEILKATIMIGPMAMLIITAILRVYMNLVAVVIVTIAIAMICIYLIYRFKKPWFYYYAAAVAIAAALFYAWPRP